MRPHDGHAWTDSAPSGRQPLDVARNTKYRIRSHFFNALLDAAAFTDQSNEPVLHECVTIASADSCVRHRGPSGKTCSGKDTAP